MTRAFRRRLPVGAEVSGSGVHFRVWAAHASRVRVVLEAEEVELASEGRGYFSGLAPTASAGSLYRLRLDDSDPLPDPCSRFQPEGPHGRSRVVDPSTFAWSDSAWRGPQLAGQVIYELHVGTFTREGTWRAAEAHLAELADLGIRTIEIMPVSEFPGRFGWGYDGVDPFAPSHLYGEPDDMRRFVDRAHALDLAVVLDVVYNHFGPDGCYLARFAPYFARRETEWGSAIDYGRPEVRELVLANVTHWIDEYHLDGLRLDATQAVFDDSTEHILGAIVRRARRSAGERTTLLAAENEPQDMRMIRSFGVDALWNDDFHHAARVATTGRNEAYYSDYTGAAQEIVSALERGFLYQGQHYAWQKKPRGTWTGDAPPHAFVHYLENHDQIANSIAGRHVWEQTSPGRHRAMTAVLLLGPQTPLLFQGQEFSTTTPFLYFADHVPELATLVRKGRAEFLAQFPSLARAPLDDPGALETFERCKLDRSDRDERALALHRDLLAIRRNDPVVRAQEKVSGAVIAPEAFVIRFAGERLLVVNLGATLERRSIAEPRVAGKWKLRWSSDDPAYGGTGGVAEAGDRWIVPGHAAFLFGPEDAS